MTPRRKRHTADYTWPHSTLHVLSCSWSSHRHHHHHQHHCHFQVRKRRIHNLMDKTLTRMLKVVFILCSCPCILSLSLSSPDTVLAVVLLDIFFVCPHSPFHSPSNPVVQLDFAAFHTQHLPSIHDTSLVCVLRVVVLCVKCVLLCVVCMCVPCVCLFRMACSLAGASGR